MDVTTSVNLIKLTICFHEADRSYLQLLEAHFAPLVQENVASIWHVEKCLPGDDRHAALLEHLTQAHVVALLVSADFNAQLDKVLSKAVMASHADNKRVVPINLRSCIWDGLPFFGLSPLPSDGAPLVVDGKPVESRFHAAATQMRELLVSLRRVIADEAPASTMAQSALFATLAWLERERFSLTQQLDTSSAPSSLPPTAPTTPPADALVPSGSPARRVESNAAIPAQDCCEPELLSSSAKSVAVGVGGQSVPAESKLARPTAPRTVNSLDTHRIELIVQREGGKLVERRLILEGDVHRVGSHPINDLVLDDRLVSRFHLRLKRGLQTWSVVDIGSLYGTRVNGLVVRDADVSTPDCRIEIGESVILVRAAGHKNSQILDTGLSFGFLYGGSPPMRKMYDLLRQLARTDTHVLIEGESGSGKDLVGAEIVRRSTRSHKPFIVVDCASRAGSIVEHELFGQFNNAVSDANLQHIGAFERADGGTLFIDNIGELPLDMQAKLLRTIETGKVCREGDTQLRKVDVRVIATTARPLERQVNQERFHEDLYCQLSVATVRVPPLRDRKEDLPLLVEASLISVDATEKRPLFTSDVLELMQRHDWPGNVRELKEFVERHIAFGTSGIDLNGAELPPSDRILPIPEPNTLSARPSHDGMPDIDRPFGVARERFERQYLALLLAWANNDIRRASRKARVDRVYLHRLLQYYGLNRTGTLGD